MLEDVGCGCHGNSDSKTYTQLWLNLGSRSSQFLIVSAPDPNQPQRGSLPVSRDTGSDPRWGWFGSGAETKLLTACSIKRKLIPEQPRGLVVSVPDPPTPSEGYGLQTTQCIDLTLTFHPKFSKKVLRRATVVVLPAQGPDEEVPL